MIALVTGSSGFCGHHLVNDLKIQGVTVKTLDSGFLETSDLESLTHCLSEAKPDFLFHLAGVAVAPTPMAFYRINVGLCNLLLESLDRAQLSTCRFLAVGTAAEYGFIKMEALPIMETAETKPCNAYGFSKLAQTQLCLLASARRPMVVARPFNVIGPGMSEHISIQNFARQLKEIKTGSHKPVVEVGNLEASRDFVDVGDVVKAYWKLLQCPAAFGQVVNICSGRAVQLGDILKRMIEITGVKVEVRMDPKLVKPIDVPEHYGSGRKLTELTGFTPSTDLDTTLRTLLA